MKKNILATILVLGWTVSAQAAVVYLKDGGTISASRVWRESETVMVLVNKESIASFSVNEINMKKTFPPRRKRVKPMPSVISAPVSAQPSQGPAVPETAKPAKSDRKSSLSGLSTRLPQLELPKGSEEGAIRKQKRQMEERLKE